MTRRSESRVTPASTDRLRQSVVAEFHGARQVSLKHASPAHDIERDITDTCPAVSSAVCDDVVIGSLITALTATCRFDTILRTRCGAAGGWGSLRSTPATQVFVLTNH